MDKGQRPAWAGPADGLLRVRGRGEKERGAGLRPSSGFSPDFANFFLAEFEKRKIIDKAKVRIRVFDFFTQHKMLVKMQIQNNFWLLTYLGLQINYCFACVRDIK